MASVRSKPKQNAKTDTTGAKQLAPYHFKKGVSGNPAGRPKHSRTKFGEQFCLDMLLDWQTHGAAAIAEVRENDPSTYLRVAASLIPKELKLGKTEQNELDKILDQFSPEQLQEFEFALRAICAANTTSSN